MKTSPAKRGHYSGATDHLFSKQAEFMKEPYER